MKLKFNFKIKEERKLACPAPLCERSQPPVIPLRTAAAPVTPSRPARAHALVGQRPQRRLSLYSSDVHPRGRSSEKGERVHRSPAPAASALDYSAASRAAVRNTSRNISRVSLPVWVFWFEGW